MQVPVLLSEHTFFDSPLHSSSTVVDLGANKGNFSNTIAQRYGCNVIAVEANPKLCENHVGNDKVQWFNAAISNSDTTAKFYVCENLESSSLYSPPPAKVVEEISVRLVRPVTLYEELDIQSIDLLKIDIEGAESDVIMDWPSELLANIPQITVEFHDFCGKLSREEVLAVIEHLESLGFRTLPMWMRSYGDTLFINPDLFWPGAIAWNHARFITKYAWWLSAKFR